MTVTPGLVSIGYEGRTIDELIAQLLGAGVDVVIDVRLTPISRKPGLSKTRLSERLAECGIEYRHYRNLGNPKDNREPFWSGRISEGVRRFRDVLAQQPDSAASVVEIKELADRSRVAVLCFERDHDRCHRQVVTEAVMTDSVGAEVLFV